MSLIFSWQDIKNRGHGLTFDDVLIVPAKSDVRSRRDPSLSSQLTKTRRMDTPIISANMDTVTEADMAIAMNKLGGVGILHRFLSIEDQSFQVRKVKDSGAQIIAASVGVNDDFKQRAQALVQAGVNLLTIDIAHGHSVQMVETIKLLKDQFPQVELIVGNLATPEAVRDLAEAGAELYVNFCE